MSIGVDSDRPRLSQMSVASLIEGRESDPNFLGEMHGLACGKAYIAVLKHVREGGSPDRLKAVFDQEYRLTMTKAGLKPQPVE